MLVSHADHSTGFPGLSHTSPPLCLLWPVGVIRESGILPDFLQSVQMEGFGQGAENYPTCTRKPRKCMGWGAGQGWEDLGGRKGQRLRNQGW